MVVVVCGGGGLWLLVGGVYFGCCGCCGCSVLDCGVVNGGSGSLVSCRNLPAVVVCVLYVRCMYV